MNDIMLYLNDNPVLFAIISILVLALGVWAVWGIDRIEEEQKNDLKLEIADLMTSCNSISTFVDLKKVFYRDNITYRDVFDLNFDLKSIHDDTKVSITFYYPEDKVKDILFDKVGSLLGSVQKVGAVDIV